jgi:epoxyqueuosine reductase
MPEERLGDWAAARGYRVATADVDILETVRRKLEARRASGLIEGRFFAEYLAKFRYLEGSSIRGAKRVVLVAVPSPVRIVSLRIGDGLIDALIPPTYVRYEATFQDVLDDMRKTALGAQPRIEVLRAPLKSLAAHMGLVRYGRNNITYAEGLGSGFQLCGYLVGTRERPAGKESGPGPAEGSLERCANCAACVRACPTGAIREDRFLIAAERCFTLHSESRRPIPSWVRPPGAVCLIGCMACQSICPENKGRLRTVRADIGLTPEETAALLEAGRKLAAGVSGSKPPKRDPALAAALTKLGELDLTDDLDVLGRNLDYFMQKQQR